MTLLWILLGFYLGGAFVTSFTVKAYGISDDDSVSEKPLFLVTMIGALCWPVTIWISQDVDGEEPL